jgi:hypothetical protein
MTLDEPTKNLVDAASFATVLGTIAGILPALAAIFTIIWTCIRIYESRTVQEYLEKKRGGRTP